VLETIAECGQSVTPYLDAWAVAAGKPAGRQLADFVSDALVGSGINSEVDEWLLGVVPSNVLAAAAHSDRDPEVAQELSDAFDHLTLHREWHATSRMQGR
jgi:hypothetical protein